jgi:hypothetical protein
MGLINGVESNLPMVGDGQILAPLNTGDEKYVGAVGASATLTEVNRVADASARVIPTTATALSLTVTQHAERVVLVNSNTTVANTFTLPAATGSGSKFTVIVGTPQTQGSIVVAALTTDVVRGVCRHSHTTAAAISAYLTTATSDKISLNATTTGGLGGDVIELWDVASGTWQVECRLTANGSQATPFSAT